MAVKKINKADYMVKSSLIRDMSNLIKWTAIILFVLYGIRWANIGKTIEAALSIPNQPPVGLKSTTHVSSYPGMKTYIIEPGAEPLKVLLRRHNVDWHSENQEYFIRYIKADGMPWRPPESNWDGWIKAGHSYKPQQILEQAGPIHEVHFKVEKTKTVVTNGVETNIPCSPVEMRVTLNPTF